MLILGLLGLAGPASAGGGLPCESGRFPVEGALLPGVPALGDAVELADGQVAIDGGCGAAAAKLRVTSRGTKLKAKWKGCAGQPGKVKLSGLLDPSCQTLTGTVRASKVKPRWKRDFAATLETGVRTCAFDPAAAPPPPPGPLAEPLTARRRPPIRPDRPEFQEAFFRALWGVVRDEYVDPLYNGVDWDAIQGEYLARIQAGLTADEFYAAMAELIEELGDDHSYFVDPVAAAVQAAELEGGSGFVGMGIFVRPLEGTGTGVVLGVYPNSPAAEAGLLSHDVLLEVDGLPYLDENDEDRVPDTTTPFELTFQHPGGAPQTVTLARRGIGGFTPFEHCAVPGAGIGYLEIPTFFDRTIPARVRRALDGLAAAGALDGLVLDVRNNGGGSSSVLLPVLDLFTDGVQGYFVASEGSTPLEAIATDLAGSQSVPLAILADEDTVSFGEVFTGVLQVSGRAEVVGEPTRGNVEVLYGYGFIDDSELWLAHATFEPIGLPAGAWEGVGVQPDVLVPMSWELFGEADDPGLAAAVGVLQGP